MTNIEQKNRTKSFNLGLLNWVRAGDINRILIRQLIRSTTSVATNYMLALKAK